MTKDLFGEEIIDYFQGKKVKAYIHRDDGYHDEMKVKKYFLPYSRFPQYEKKALKYVKGKILDIGCGPGRVLLWLQRKGYQSTGIDISPTVIKVAKLRGVKNILKGNALNLNFPKNCFDTIILFGNNFGIGGTYRGVKKMLKRFQEITKKNGRIILTSHIPEKTANINHLKCHQRNKKKGLPIGQMKLRHEYKGKVSKWFPWIILGPGELEKIAKKSNWKMEKVFESKDSQYSAILIKL